MICSTIIALGVVHGYRSFSSSCAMFFSLELIIHTVPLLIHARFLDMHGITKEEIKSAISFCTEWQSSS